MSRRVLAALAVVASCSTGAAFAQNDQQMACAMAPGLSLGMEGIEQMDQGFAVIASQMDQIRVTAPQVAALLQQFMSESGDFANIYRYTVSELERICGQKP